MAIELTEALVSSWAPTDNAMNDARAVLRKRGFTALNKTEDDSLLWGLCKGSGAKPYELSVDLGTGADRPTTRCTCPSRQFPCKHALAIMLAFVDSAKSFKSLEAPKDLLDKRGKLAEKSTKVVKEESPEKKAAKEEKAKATAKVAAAKKTEQQAEALDMLEKFVLDLVAGGLGGLSSKGVKAIQDQAARMNDADLRGAWGLLMRLADVAESDVGSSGTTKRLVRKSVKKGAPKKGATPAPDAEAEAAATSSPELEVRNAKLANLVTGLWVTVRKGRKMLEGKLEEGDTRSESDAAMESLLGRAWKLPELKEAGYWITGRTYLELAHERVDDKVLQMVNTRGFLLDLEDGSVHTEWTALPYIALRQAAGNLRQARSQVLNVSEAALYPGDVVNRRVRWDEKSDALATEPRAAAHYASVHKQAKTLDAAVKQFREQLKNPLSPTDAVVLVAVKEFGLTDDDALVMVDHAGGRLVLRDPPDTQYETVANLVHAAGAFGAGSLAVRLWFNLHERGIYGQPLALFAGDKHLRLGL